jgi:hypothetical protein
MAATSATTTRNEDKSPSFESDFSSGKVLDGALLLVSVFFVSAPDRFEQLTASASGKIINATKATVGEVRYLGNLIVFGSKELIS